MTERPRNLICLSGTKTFLAPPLEPLEGNTNSNLPPLEVVYTTDAETIEAWLQDHASRTNLLGFDTESVPRADFLPYGRRPHNEKEGPATLQLATADSCLIIHLAHCKWDRAPDGLQNVLKSSSLLKAGVGIDDDALELYRSSFALEMNGRFDLSCVLEGSSPRQRIGLGPLLAKTSHLQLPKSKKISLSNWGAPKLSQTQLEYAAYDAWASVQIVRSLPESQLDLNRVIHALQEQERPMNEIDVRARTRKQAKTEWKKLQQVEGEWTTEQRMEQERLWQLMGEMRPDPPLELHISIPEQIQ